MTAQERAHFWDEKIIAWQTSGLSCQAFCQQNHLTYHQFLYWRQKKHRSSTAQIGLAIGFAKVTPIATTTTCEELRINLPSGLSITGIHANNIDLLGTLLRRL